jgi:hypothetical protein
MKPRDLPVFRNEAALKLLKQTASKHGVTVQLLRDLLEIQRNYTGSGRQLGITSEFSSCLAEFLEEEDR